MPPAVRNDVEDAVFLASSYGLTPDDWQEEDILTGWLGRDANNRWASATCGLAVPRQNGKNGAIEVRELFGMVGLGEKFLHTAHEVKTARKAFLRIASFFENERKYPELKALVKEIRKTNGQEAVILTNGGSVEFVARSKGSGRGFTVDVLVLDEAQDLKDEELEALLPTISAAPLGNPQVILTGTPPDPEKNQTGEVFTRVRADGESGADPKLCWTDYGVADGPLPDRFDRELWYATNPAIGSRVGIEEIERELGLLSEEGFARERLGWWGDPAALAAGQMISADTWADLLDSESDFTGPVAFGVYMAWDRSSTAIVAAGRRADGKYHIEVLPAAKDGAKESLPGTRWVTGRVVDIHDAWNPVAVVIDGYSAAASLLPALEEAGVTPVVTNSSDMAKACGNFYDAVMEDNLRHLGSPRLASAVVAAKKRDLQDAWAWDRKDRTSDITQLVAATLALHGLIAHAPEKPKKIPQVHAWPDEEEAE